MSLHRCNQRCTFTKSAHAQIIATLIWFPMRCHSVGCGTPNRMREGQPPRKNDRPKRCPSPWVGSVSDRPRLGSSAICVDRPASPLCEILLSKLVTFQSPFDSDDTVAVHMTLWSAFMMPLARLSRRSNKGAVQRVVST